MNSCVLDDPGNADRSLHARVERYNIIRYSDAPGTVVAAVVVLRCVAAAIALGELSSAASQLLVDDDDAWPIRRCR